MLTLLVTQSQDSTSQDELVPLLEVTDVYFLAGYYGLMEVLVDEIKRLTNGCSLHARAASPFGFFVDPLDRSKLVELPAAACSAQVHRPRRVRRSSVSSF